MEDQYQHQMKPGESFREFYHRTQVIEESPNIVDRFLGDEVKLDNAAWNQNTSKLIRSKGKDFESNFANTNLIESINTFYGYQSDLYRDVDSIITDWWINHESQYIQANFKYRVENSVLYGLFVWKWQLASQGFARYLMINYYLKKFSAVVSDSNHTPLGRDFWQKLIEECKSKHKIVVLTGNIYTIDDMKKGVVEEPIDLNNIDQYWTSKTKSRIKIYAK